MSTTIEDFLILWRVKLAMTACPTDQTDSESSDLHLVNAFCETGSHDAFAALTAQHIGMVLGVCQRLLGRSSDADDAVQAVFILLWQKAGKLRSHPSIAGWLFCTASNVCRRARREQLARTARERDFAGINMESHSDQDETLWKAAREVLDEEIGRLPEKLRLPLILFHLEGRPLAEIASLLNTGVPTIGTWLQRAREQLSARLTRRGVSIPAAALAAFFAAHAADAATLRTLANTTLQAAANFAAGTSAIGASLSPGVVSLVKGTAIGSQVTLLKVCAAISGTLLLVCAVAVAMISAVPDADVALLQGEWRMIAAERDGQALPESNFKPFNDRIVIAASRLTQYQTLPDGKEISGNDGSFSLDRSSAPHAIDISARQGMAYGIYALDGDVLTLCITQNGGPRPAGFQTSPGDNRLLQKYGRITAPK